MLSLRASTALPLAHEEPFHSRLALARLAHYLASNLQVPLSCHQGSVMEAYSRQSAVEGPLSKKHRSSEARQRRASPLVYIYIYIYNVDTAMIYHMVLNFPGVSAMQSVYDDFTTSSYAACCLVAICNDVISYKWPPASEQPSPQ